MKAPRRSAARAAITLIASVAMCIAFLFMPSKGRAAPEKKGAAPPAASAAVAAKDAKHAKDDDKTVAAAKAKDVKEEHEKPAPAEEVDLTSMPTGSGIPVVVSTAVQFLELKAFDDNGGTFEASLDIRLQWRDLRHRFPRSEAPRGYKEFRGKKADEAIEKIWTPDVQPTNRVEEPSVTSRRLRFYTDGTVETITRTTAKYKVTVLPERFPFDRQKLLVELLVREATTDDVVLEFDKDDIEFSRVARTAKLENWALGMVDLRGGETAGWNGDRYSRIRATLTVDRDAGSSLAPIFIPLVASLLIPLLTIWMNRATEEGFEVPGFELANMGIGGLFSVIALSFAIYSAYGIVAGSDNTVTRLFGLNYVSLAMALGIVVVFFRYNLVHRWFGHYVQKEVFLFIAWAMPLMSLATSIAFLLVAAA